MPQHPIDETVPFVPVRIAVLTVSDTRDESNDTSGDTLAARIKDAGHVLADRALLRDDQSAIRLQLERWIADPEVDVVISTGGTGLTGRDVTVEAFKSVFEKEIDGFSVIFHQISFEKVGTSTLQSRACAGVAHPCASSAIFRTTFRRRCCSASCRSGARSRICISCCRRKSWIA